MKLVIDRGKCSGLGDCEAEAPDVFEVGDDGFANALQENPDDSPALRTAVAGCPMGALKLVP